MSHSPRPFSISYYASQGLANRDQHSKRSHASSHINAVIAATRRLLNDEFLCANVFSPTGSRLTSIVKTRRQISFAGLLP